MTRRYSDGYRKRTAVDQARSLAFDVLTQVHTQDAFANIVLPAVLREAKNTRSIDGRDSAFISEIVYGSLRQQGYLDWVLSRHSTRALAELDPQVLVLLRMGAYQLLFMRVGDHAALSTTVDLAREYLTDGPAKFINAVLRGITREGEEERRQLLAEISSEQRRRGIEFSHPEWMVTAFEDALDQHAGAAEEIEDLLAANNEAPIVTLVARPELISIDDLEAEVHETVGTRTLRGGVSPYALLMEHGDPAQVAPIRSGHAGAQDEGSQLAALCAAHAPLEGPDKKWLDLCAGPGGKTALLASVGVQRGAHVIANEVHPHRARLVERSVRQLPNVDVICGDGRTLGGKGTSFQDASFDRIIVDAPCTGLGSMRRRPESRWRRVAEDLSNLVQLQMDLLKRAYELLRPGGVLTYVTCSPHTSETLQQVRYLTEDLGAQLLDTAGVAQSIAVDPLEGIEELVGKPSTVQLWEHRHGTDLMFFACVTKPGQ